LYSTNILDIPACRCWGEMQLSPSMVHWPFVWLLLLQ